MSVSEFSEKSSNFKYFDPRSYGFGFTILVNMWSPLYNGALLEYGLYLSTFLSSVPQIYLDTELWLNMFIGYISE